MFNVFRGRGRLYANLRKGSKKYPKFSTRRRSFVGRGFGKPRRKTGLPAKVATKGAVALNKTSKFSKRTLPIHDTGTSRSLSYGDIFSNISQEKTSRSFDSDNSRWARIYRPFGGIARKVSSVFDRISNRLPQRPSRRYDSFSDSSSSADGPYKGNSHSSNNYGGPCPPPPGYNPFEWKKRSHGHFKAKLAHLKSKFHSIGGAYSPFWCLPNHHVPPVIPAPAFQYAQPCCKSDNIPWWIILLGGVLVAVTTQSNRINITNDNDNTNNVTGGGHGHSKNVNKNISINANLTGVGSLLGTILNNTNFDFGGGFGLGGSVSISDITNVGNNGGVAIIAGGDVNIDGGVIANGAPGPFARVQNVSAPGGGLLISDESARLVDKMDPGTSEDRTPPDKMEVASETPFSELETFTVTETVGEGAMSSDDANTVMVPGTETVAAEQTFDVKTTVTSITPDSEEGSEEETTTQQFHFGELETSTLVAENIILTTEIQTTIQIEPTEEIPERNITFSTFIPQIGNEVGSEEEETTQENTPEIEEFPENLDENSTRVNDKEIQFEDFSSFEEVPLPFIPFGSRSAERVARSVLFLFLLVIRNGFCLGHWVLNNFPCVASQFVLVEWLS